MKNNNAQNKRNSRHCMLIESCAGDPATNELTKPVLGKIIIETRPAHWINTQHSVIVPLSINSKLSQSNDGRRKIAALLNLVKTNVKGKVSVLLCEKSHMHTLSLRYNDNYVAAEKKAMDDAQELTFQLKKYLTGCDVAFWKDRIDSDCNYNYFKDKVYDIYQNDQALQSLLNSDVTKTYNEQRAQEFKDRELYLSRAKLDLLEQCIYLLIIAYQGYKFEFYPGKRIASANLINDIYIDNVNRLTRVNVKLGNYCNPGCQVLTINN